MINNVELISFELSDFIYPVCFFKYYILYFIIWVSQIKYIYIQAYTLMLISNIQFMDFI